MKRLPPVKLPPDRHDLVLRNMGFAVAHGLRVAKGRLSREEVESVGGLAMTEAAAHCVDRGKFLAYASFFVRKRIFEAIRDRNLIHVQQAFYQRRSGWLDRTPRADSLRVDARRAMAVGSLDISDPETGLLLSTLIPTRLDEDPVDSERVARRVDALPRAEREVITSRFGLGGGGCLTYDAIGRKMGVSRQRVRFIERRALDRLRERMSVAC